MDLTAAWQSADDQISSSSNNNNNIKATITNNNPQTLFKGPLQVKVRYACYYSIKLMGYITANYENLVNI